MEFNKKTTLFNKNIYSYDISACHYQIIKKLGFNLSNINENDKLQRNIKIGLMMKDNPKLVTIIRKTTESIINEYLLRNNLNEDDLLIRQYDGFLTKKNLKITSLSIPISLKDIFINMLISIDRKMYLANSEKNIIIKGVPRKFKGIENILGEIIKINFTNKNVIFNSLQKIKNEFFLSDDPFLFSIPISENRCYIYVKRYGEIELSTGILSSIDIDDIDKQKYYDIYIKPFTKSIVLEFM